MLFNNVAAPFVVRVTCRGMFEEEEELLPKNPDDEVWILQAHQLDVAGKDREVLLKSQ